MPIELKEVNFVEDQYCKDSLVQSADLSVLLVLLWFWNSDWLQLQLVQFGDSSEVSIEKYF